MLNRYILNALRVCAVECREKRGLVYHFLVVEEGGYSTIKQRSQAFFERRSIVSLAAIPN